MAHLGKLLREGGSPDETHPNSQKIVLIGKPGKDLSLVKGWRPIALSNCIHKLCEKVVADELQGARHEGLLFYGAFGGRKGVSFMDELALAVVTESGKLVLFRSKA